jgi:hypothetical protein
MPLVQSGCKPVQTLKAGALYFALTFGAGFLLGAIRVMWVVPRFGTRMAELMEMPLMLGVTVFTARWVIRHLAVPPALSSRLGMGCIGLALMLTAEFVLVLRLRGISFSEYFAARDPVSGTAYYMVLALFAVMPILAARK